MAKILHLSDQFGMAYNNSNADSLTTFFDEDARYARIMNELNKPD